MRTIVLLLLLANFTLFGYTRLDSVGSGESMRLAQQVRPDAIKLLTAQQVAALGPSKIAALVEQARIIGYRELKLDTLAWMEAARHLYASFGFRDCAPYYVNPLPGVVYMAAPVSQSSRADER